MKKISLSLILTVILLVCTEAAAQKAPRFEVIGQYYEAYSLLVPAKTSEKQLHALIDTFRKAREENRISAIFPSWKTCDNPALEIFVFTEIEWAAGDKLQQFILVDIEKPADKEFAQTYVKHVKAHYQYIPDRETGGIGFNDGTFRSPKCKNLFQQMLPAASNQEK